MLEDDGSTYTAFAPTDTAFEKVAKGDLAALTADAGALAALLKGHLLPKAVRLEGLPDGTELETFAGEALTLHKAGGALTVQAPRGGAVANVVLVDVPACSSYVNAIDMVLFPGKAEEPVAEKPVPTEKPLPIEKPLPVEKPVPVEDPKPVHDKPSGEEKPVEDTPVPKDEPVTDKKPTYGTPLPKEEEPVEKPLPKEEAPVDKPLPKQEEPAEECPTPAALVEDTPQLKRLAELLKMAGLLAAVDNNEAELTIFAPNDAAVMKLTDETLEALTGDVAALKTVRAWPSCVVLLGCNATWRPALTRCARAAHRRPRRARRLQGGGAL